MSIDYMKQNRELAKLVIPIQNAAILRGRWSCCTNCGDWSKSSIIKVADGEQWDGYREVHNGPICMRFNKLPPPDVIVVGCEFWVETIPF